MKRLHLGLLAAGCFLLGTWVGLQLAGSRVWVACESNATAVAVDDDHGTVTARLSVGRDPDVLAFDDARHRLYIAAESGTVAVVDAASARVARYLVPLAR